MASLLQTAASEGMDILNKLSTVCHNKYQCPPLSPAYVQGSKAVILLRGTKAGELGFTVRRPGCWRGMGCWVQRPAGR